ncbi:MAG: arginine--tRNA ligase [Anaerolineae bacterium]|nr:arginine--tRNA ligase [Anaerolineae bacterium]MBN8617441.1 arginine--tRNA ligase [Anaerolineae bacterium]
MKLLTTEHARLIAEAIQKAQSTGQLPPFELPTIEIRPPKKADQGDYACAIAMQIAALADIKAANTNPFDIATTIVQNLPAAGFVSRVEAVRPGFINFWLSEEWLKAQVETIIAEDDTFFRLDKGLGKRAQVEFVSANPTGPLHVGRSRGAMVGDTIARLLEAAGYAVEREYYFNNAGVQMVNLGNSLRIRYLEVLGQPVQIPAEDDTTFYQGVYLQEFARDLVTEQGDALKDADWKPFKEYAEKRMFEIIRGTLRRVNVVHDVFFNENSLYESGAVWETLAALEKAGHIYESATRENADAEEIEKAQHMAPAKWFRSTTFGDNEDRVVVKNDGNPTYTLPDIAYHMNKLGRGFDLLVNILGADHGAQYKVVQYGVKALGMDASKINVVIIQLVRMIRDGKEVKMSTRRGDYDTLDDLIDQTSPDVVRYILLARSADSHLNFDLDLAVKQSNDNPVYYVQNAHVRCAGILREAGARGLSDEDADVQLLGSAEQRFLRKALELGEVIDVSTALLEPHRIAFYAHELAGIFHPIYDEVRAMHGDVSPEVAKARLRFYRAAQVVFKRVLNLMGMSAPERM